MHEIFYYGDRLQVEKEAFRRGSRERRIVEDNGYVGRYYGEEDDGDLLLSFHDYDLDDKAVIAVAPDVVERVVELEPVSPQQAMLSVKDFYRRFHLTLTYDLAMARFVEEAMELANAPRSTALAEIGDVLFTLYGVAQAYGFTPDEVTQAFRQVLDKNDRKSLATHYLTEVDGKTKITRKSLAIIAPNGMVAEQMAEGREYLFLHKWNVKSHADFSGEVLACDCDDTDIAHTVELLARHSTGGYVLSWVKVE